MKIVSSQGLNRNEVADLLARPFSNGNQALQQEVLKIMQLVKTQGDKAVISLTLQFDKIKLENIQVSQAEYIEAYDAVSIEDLELIRVAIKRIKAYHQAQIPDSFIFDSQDGIQCERQLRPIERVGLYIPAGSAPLISTVMMLAIPASIAGCKERIVCTPPDSKGKINPFLLVTAKECGIDFIAKIGGAQAVAAMAYGTESMSKVDKIFGPGNAWVTQAKMLCAQENQGVSIDMPAGPSELLIIADDSALPEFIAADLLSQAEHDVRSQVILITSSRMLAEKVQNCLDKQLMNLARQNIAAQALANGRIIITQSIAEAITLSNRYAPEHLSLQVENPEQYCAQIHNAGTVFMGCWTAESLGDYINGPNHVLPTGGFARSVSGLSVLDFMKWIGFQRVSLNGLKNVGPIAQCLAQMEELKGHENAVTLRLAEVMQNV